MEKIKSICLFKCKNDIALSYRISLLYIYALEQLRNLILMSLFLFHYSLFINWLDFLFAGNTSKCKYEQLQKVNMILKMQ